MSRTKAKAAKGTLLQRGDGATPENFATIGEVTSFGGPNGTLTTIDATNFDSEADEYVAGLPNSGEVTFDYNFVASDNQQQGLETDRKSGTLRNFRIVLNDHPTNKTSKAFAAFVAAVGLTGQGPNQKYTGSCTLRSSGDTTTTNAPS